MHNPGNALLVVVDMQNDFLTGTLANSDAERIVPAVAEKVKGFAGQILFTRDTHTRDYLSTQEGELLPVPHCVAGTPGWEIHADLEALRTHPAVDKPSFGSLALADKVRAMHAEAPLNSITLVGVCTDICVISNALILKAALPEVKVTVDAALCAGVTPDRHRTALEAMKACQVEVINA